ncbi:hypothetical protein Hthe01_18900 [Hydrogenophilus thermoluteolus]|uniref:hypothetical protein n=1 Tax=Hydrogenophilus thermoluteolus TaxID=297 RepID=UPI0024A46BA1|nr:hypothetical protein [Hydrogenophilus thermoluteolus]GLW61541.1 hypothetical protein Hthe01_18900 [Hydrogenophilus thermoluteolus]
MREHVITWALSVISSCIVGAAWIYTHPVPRPETIAVVDLNALLSEEVAKIDREIKPDMTPQEKEQVAGKVSMMTKRIEDATKALAAECGCVVVNAAAVVANGSRNVRDMTWRARELASSR